MSKYKKRCKICIEDLLPDGTCPYASTHPKTKLRNQSGDNTVGVPIKRESLLTPAEALAATNRVFPGRDAQQEKKALHSVRCFPRNRKALDTDTKKE